MQNINWNGLNLRIQTYNVQVGTYQLELTRCFRKAEGTPVFMLPGLLETHQIFMPSPGGNNGLAALLAAEGYDVYMGSLRGKGQSWPRVNKGADWGVHEAVCEDIPAHLKMLQRLRPDTPHFWLGQGMGSLLLLASLARTEQLETPLLGLLHLATGRHCALDTWQKRWVKTLGGLGGGLANVLYGYVKVPFSKPPRADTRNMWRAWRQWQYSDQWLDPQDAFDYGAALAQQILPPSFYLANGNNVLWGNVDACRSLVSHLGPHDGRMLAVSKRGGNRRDYSARGLLTHPQACEDHFQQLLDWLREQHNNAPSNPTRSALASNTSLAQ